MSIRPLARHDKDSIHHLMKQRGMFTSEEIQVALELVDEVVYHPEKNNYYAFCTTDSADFIAGYICFGPIPMTDRCFELYWIAVDERCSSQGIGGKLIGQMEAFVAGKNARRVYVETSSTSPYRAARAFYRKHGYRVVGMLHDFYRQGDHNMIFMKELEFPDGYKETTSDAGKHLQSN